MTDAAAAEFDNSQMNVTSEFDARVRRDLSAAYRRAPALLGLGALDEARNVWTNAAGSAATREPLIETGLLVYAVAELDSGGVNLPLSQARSLLSDAAATFKALASITVDDDTAVRFSAIAPLARSITERASTVAWILAGPNAEQRLQRSLLVEIRGLEFLLKYLPEIRNDRDSSDLVHARNRFLQIADDDAGGFAVDKKGMVLSVGGERRATLTSIVSEMTTPHTYAELSVHTHPTGYLQVASSETSSGGGGQVWFHRKSTVHDEGRLCEGAVLAFGRAVVTVANHIGSEAGPVYAWTTDVVEHCREWCHANGCN